jgi:hypothetical protein
VLETKNKQIKSKDRVSTHGEVFTGEREVNAMLDLVKQETERIESRFLEPACGNGNFLAEILRRKLEVVRERYSENKQAYELHALIAVASIYGIDILRDNVEECREKLFQIFFSEYTALFPQSGNLEYIDSARFVLERNILWGDALTLETSDETRTPIVFSEWSAIGDRIKRRDFTLDMLLKNQPMNEPNLFSDLGDEAFISKPVAEYLPVHFTKIHRHDKQL